MTNKNICFEKPDGKAVEHDFQTTTGLTSCIYCGMSQPILLAYDGQSVEVITFREEAGKKMRAVTTIRNSEGIPSVETKWNFIEKEKVA